MDNESSAKKLIDRYSVSPLTVLYKLLKDYFLAIVGAAMVALILRVFVIEAFRIPTDFMSPALLPGDLIFVNKLAYTKMPWAGERKPARGDVVIFAFPSDPTKDYIKRVVAVEGDMVEIRSNQVYLNGKSISQPMDADVFEEDIGGHRYYADWAGAAADARKMVSVKVPSGQVFVLGDNRAKGQDSRGWGFIPASGIKGKASFIWFSLASDGGTRDRGTAIRWSRIFTRVN